MSRTVPHFSIGQSRVEYITTIRQELETVLTLILFEYIQHKFLWTSVVSSASTFMSSVFPRISRNGHLPHPPGDCSSPTNPIRSTTQSSDNRRTPLDDFTKSSSEWKWRSWIVHFDGESNRPCSSRLLASRLPRIDRLPGLHHELIVLLRP